MPRVSIEAADALLDTKTKCLNHGWVVPIDYMGGDQRIIDAARVCVSGDAVKATSTNKQLIRYLLRHKHTTPFEKVRFEFAAKMPIFVARQWVRHRMASINEMSGRYGELPQEFYIPEMSRMATQSKNNKQGSGVVLGTSEAGVCQAKMSILHNESYKTYQALLDDHGLARELARGVLPVNLYTKWYWTIDLWNLMNFLRLRLDPHAQYEIRVYAEQMEKFARAVAPIAMEAFDDYIRNARSMSAMEMALLGKLLNGTVSINDDLEPHLGSKREVVDFKKKMSEVTSD